MILSKGFFPAWLEAKLLCPRGCQSWVATISENEPISRLTAGMIASPPGTGNAPPGKKSFCISTSKRAFICLSAVGFEAFNHLQAFLHPWHQLRSCEKHTAHFEPGHHQRLMT